LRGVAQVHPTWRAIEDSRQCPLALWSMEASHALRLEDQLSHGLDQADQIRRHDARRDRVGKVSVACLQLLIPQRRRKGRYFRGQNGLLGGVQA
jgi:hypothetical protein